MLKKRPNSTPCLFQEHIDGKLTVQYNVDTVEASNLTRSRVLYLLEEEVKYIEELQTKEQIANLILNWLDYGHFIIEEEPLKTN